MKRLGTWTAAGFVVLIVLASPLIQVSAVLAQGTWMQATLVLPPANAGPNPFGVFGGISCSSEGNCTAAGDYLDNSGAGQAMAASESRGSWARGTKVNAPANAGSNPAGNLEGISCWSSGNCTASGQYDDSSGAHQAMAATATAGNWARATEVAAPANAGATNPAALLSGISCQSAGNCTAAGDYRNGSGAQVMVATESSGIWAHATEVTVPGNAGADPQAALTAIACPSMGNCTAVGEYIDSSGHAQVMVVTESGGSWTHAIEGTTPTNAGAFPPPSAAFYGISCASIGNCTATGTYNDKSGHAQLMAARESAGHWARGLEIPPPSDALTNPEGELSAISCSSAGDCTAAGTYVDSSGGQAMVATETGGAWARATKITPVANSPTNPVGRLNGVSCPSPSNCTASGGYIDGFGHEQAMVATEASSAHAIIATPTTGYDGSRLPVGVLLVFSGTGLVALGRRRARSRPH